MVWLLLLLAASMSVSLAGAATDDQPIPDEPEPEPATEGDDALYGGIGNDLIEALGGDDTVQGGLGDDTLDGGAGDDLLHGGLGVNVVHGGEGDDTIRLNDGFETGPSRDDDGNLIPITRSFLDGGDGGETGGLSGGDLLDATRLTESVSLNLSHTEASLHDRAAPLRAVDLDGFERYALGSGDDEVIALGADLPLSVQTGAGDDSVLAGNGPFRIETEQGDDAVTLDLDSYLIGTGSIVGGGTRDEIEGDTLTIETQRQLTVVIDNSGSGTLSDPDGGEITFRNFEHFDIGGVSSIIDASAHRSGVSITAESGDITGGRGDDTLSGDQVNGGAGDDLITDSGSANGGAGNDRVFADEAFGGAGDDTVGGAEMTGGSGLDHFEASTTATFSGGVSQSVITDYQTGESIALTIRYPSTDGTNPLDPPLLTTEEDPGANEVRLLVNGEPALVIQGTSSVPSALLDITFEAYDPFPID